MEEPIMPMTEEGKNEPQLNKDDANSVLQHPRHCSLRIHPTGPDRRHKVVLQSSVAFEGEHSAKVTRSVALKGLDSP
jgi:hypothetical protein